MVLWENVEATDKLVTISGSSGAATVDPVTLALLTVDENPSG